MSSSAKKGGTLGVGQKLEKSENSGNTPSKGDGVITTPSKSSKHGVNKKNAGNKGNDNVSSPQALNQQALESLYSVTYVEDFLDCNDNMGNDLIRQTTRMFEMGSNYMSYVRELESAMAVLLGEDDDDGQLSPELLNSERRKAVFRLQQVLMTAQDTGDDSLQVMQGIQDHIETKTRQLELDRKNLSEFCKEQNLQESAFKDPPPPPTERNIKRARRNRHEIYRPSILGPSSLKATSYPETVSNSCREQQDTNNVVTSSGSGRSRDRDRGGGGGDSQNQSTSSTSSTTGASASSSNDPVPSTTNNSGDDQQQTPQKTNGRTSERSSASSLRNSTAAAAAANSTENSSSNNDKNSGTSNSGYSSTPSSKKQSQKTQAQQEKKTKKRKAKQSSSNSKDDNSPQQYPIDPDEPTYCLCDQVSYGEMIGCDNDLCPIEWFHFSCVSLTTKPKGKWYCPKCRGDRPNIMKPKAIFLKELEKYNREKEEKA